VKEKEFTRLRDQLYLLQFGLVGIVIGMIYGRSVPRG